MSNDGGSIIISERTRFASFEVRVDFDAAVWMLETLNEVLERGSIDQFVRKYRGHSSVLIAERYSNQRGVFLKFTQIRNGGVHNIIVPGGRSLWGWKQMAACLFNILGRKCLNGGANKSGLHKPTSGYERNLKKRQPSKTIKIGNWLSLYIAQIRECLGTKFAVNLNP